METLLREELSLFIYEGNEILFSEVEERFKIRYKKIVLQFFHFLFYKVMAVQSVDNCSYFKLL